MNRKNGIDLFRLIGAFFIMLIHASYGNLGQEYVENILLLGRWAVPFYFMTTGFFIGKKIDNGVLDFKKIQNNISVLISIYVIANIIYILINVYNGWFLYGIEKLVTGTFFHLWFISSLLFGYMFIWYLYFIKINKVLPYISVLIVVLAILSDAYDQFFNIRVDYTLFRFLLSIPFLYIGIVISTIKEFRINKNIFIGLAIVGLAIQMIESNYLKTLFDYKKDIHQFLIGTILTAIPLFIYSTTINMKENTLTRWGKQHSLFIYLYHPIVYISLYVFITRMFPKDVDAIKICSPVIAFVLILSAAIFLDNIFPRVYGILNGNLVVKDEELDKK